MNDEHKLIAFMASFCWNCCTADSFEETVKGREEEIMGHYRAGFPGWASAAAIQSGGSPQDHM
jgi:hypothetical protein